jgi:malonyl-CoA/methylmalonyl-CoA synthetase
LSGSLLPALAVGGSKPALRFPEGTLDYDSLRAAARRLGPLLHGCDRVAVWAEPRIETCVAIVAALEAGVPIVPVNPRSGGAELAHVLTDSAPDLLLVGGGTGLPEAAARLPVVEVAWDAAGGEVVWDEAERVDDEAPALIVYTSGTTGAPKGAVLPRRAIASNLDALAVAWAWTADDEVAHALPLFHVHGLVLGILGPLRRGGTARHLGRFSPEAVADALAGESTMFFGVPTMYRRLADAAEQNERLARALGRARLLGSGSAALPVAGHERLQRLTGRHVLERYGMTETLINTAVPIDAEAGAGTVGLPLAGIGLRIVDDAGEEISGDDDEAIGEIEVRGPNLFLGYRNRPDATAEAFHEGWFRTGDLAVLDTRGVVRIVGRRATDLIKSGGFKIGAGEVENALREHSAVDDAAVTAAPDPDLGETVVAWVELRDGSSAEEQELIDHVAAQLAPHKRPRVVHFVAELPRNEMGKVQKTRLTHGPSRS